MIRNQLAVFALLILTSQQLAAQQSKPLTLNEAIQLSIQNSPKLKVASAKLEQATAAVQEAQDARLPSADLTGGYLRVNQPNINMKSSGGGSGSGEEVKVNQAMYGLLNLSLPIFTGGKIKYGIESARYLAEAAKLNSQFQAADLVNNTVAAYFNLFKAGKAVELMKESLLQSQERVREFRNLETNGLLARNDLLKAELQSADKELALLDAQNNWQVATVNMNLLLGLPESTLLLLDSSRLNQTEALLPLQDYIDAALSNRKDLEKLGYQQKAAQLGVKTLQSDKLPSLALTGGYAAINLPGFLSVTNAVNLGVGVKYNIGSLWKGKTKIREAEAKVSELEADRADQVNQIRLDITRNYFSLLSHRKKIEVFQKSIEQADENFRITRNKYENSLANTTELLDADLAQLQARMNYLFARADDAVLYSQLLTSAGLTNQQP